MVSQSVHKLPVIDLSSENLKPGSSSWFSARQDVVCGLEEYGAFIVIYEKVSSQLSKSLFAAAEELLDLPTEIKIKNTDPNPFHGYETYSSGGSLYEGLSVGDARSIEEAQSFANRMWPTGNNHFCEIAHSYAKLVADLEKMVTKMVFESYGAEIYHDSHVASTRYLHRFIKYTPLHMNENNVGLSSHTDKGFTAILHTSQVSGLQIKAKDSDEWFDVEVPPSSFIFLAGDALMAWSNCRVRACIHRVFVKGDKRPRYTIVQFTIKNGITETPKELVDEEHPLRFKPFDNAGLINFADTEEGKKVESLIEAYCGI